MDPIQAFLAKYGVGAVIAYLLLKDLGGYLLARFFPPKAPPAPLPALPSGTPPTTPSFLKDAVNALLERLGHPPVSDLSQLHPEVQAAIRAGAASLPAGK